MYKKKLAAIQSFRGLISPPFTPFKENGDLNAGIIPKYVDHLVNQGVKGVFVNGTTGEGLSLTMEERKTVAEEWMKAGKDKLELIIISVGANCIKDSQELAAHAERIGATAVLCLPPIFFKPKTHDQLIAYFKSISSAAPTLPFMLYHFPDNSGVQIELAEFMPKARKAIPNFCGAKFTSTEVRDLLECLRLPGEPFTVFPGYEEVLLPCLSCGVKGAIGAVYNFMGPASLRILDAFNKGDIAKAREYQNEVLEAFGALISKSHQEISYFKAAMNILGPLDVGPPRLPLDPLSPEALHCLKENLKKIRAEEWCKK